MVSTEDPGIPHLKVHNFQVNYAMRPLRDSRILDTRFWILDSGCSVLGFLGCELEKLRAQVEERTSGLVLVQSVLFCLTD